MAISIAIEPARNEMPRLTKIYTRTGDDGTTSLGSGDRVPKDSRRIESYGTVDELNSTIGVAIAGGLVDPLPAQLKRIQNELFHLGSDLCFPDAEERGIKIPMIDATHVAALETDLDGLSENIPPLENFILPGGSPGSAALHVARCVCRRAERELQGLAREEKIRPDSLPYLNRLSDLLFVMSRHENRGRGTEDVCWDSRA